MRRVLIAILALLALAGCGGPSEADIQATVSAAVAATAQAKDIALSVAATQEAEQACAEKALSEYADAIDVQVRSFRQQAQLVSSTPRASLGGPLQKLLDIQTETRKVKVPACLKEFHTRVGGMMELYQLAYQNFAAQGSEISTQAFLQVADDELKAITEGIATIRTGQMPALPTPAPTPTV
jgi:uncharacterized protein YcfL